MAIGLHEATVVVITGAYARGSKVINRTGFSRCCTMKPAEGIASSIRKAIQNLEGRV